MLTDDRLAVNRAPFSLKIVCTFRVLCAIFIVSGEFLRIVYFELNDRPSGR